jgi:RNase P/RNase MRP subunit p30
LFAMKKHLLMIWYVKKIVFFQFNSIQKVNEVFKKLKLCNVETDDNDVNCCKRCYIELNNKSDIPSFWKGKRNMHQIIVVHIYCKYYMY